MRRRTFLVAMGASLGGVTGCVSSSGGPSPTGTADGRTTTRSTPRRSTSDGSLPTFTRSAVQRSVALEAVDDVDDHPVSVDATLENGTVTGSEPARIRITVTNESARAMELTNNEGECSLLNRGHGASTPPGLHLYQQSFPGYALECANTGRRGNLWRLDLPRSTRCVVQSYGCSTVSYEAGESKSVTYEVWDDHTAPGYMVPDTYRFERELATGDPEQQDTLSWGVSLAVARPDE